MKEPYVTCLHEQHSLNPFDRNNGSGSVALPYTLQAFRLQSHHNRSGSQKLHVCLGNCLTLTSLTTLASSIPSSSPSAPVPADAGLLVAFSFVAHMVSELTSPTSSSAGSLS